MKFITSSVLIAAAQAAAEDLDPSICRITVHLAEATTEHPPAHLASLQEVHEEMNSTDVEVFKRRIQSILKEKHSHDWPICRFTDGEIYGEAYNAHKQFFIHEGDPSHKAYDCWITGCSNCVTDYSGAVSQQCGGKNWKGHTCCAPWFQSWEGGQFQLMECRPDDNEDWSGCKPVKTTTTTTTTTKNVLKSEGKSNESTESSNTTTNDGSTPVVTI